MIGRTSNSWGPESPVENGIYGLVLRGEDEKRFVEVYWSTGPHIFAWDILDDCEIPPEEREGALWYGPLYLPDPKEWP